MQEHLALWPRLALELHSVQGASYSHYKYDCLNFFEIAGGRIRTFEGAEPTDFPNRVWIRK
jgi:hypothetical protein